ncbi:MAG: zinc ribbon domain-containing protein [Candidatus ainarchaeum sp.]|nr:zinc ribbon domain-containing protein [Candidatus ainarchaeum sp.]
MADLKKRYYKCDKCGEDYSKDYHFEDDVECACPKCGRKNNWYRIAYENNQKILSKTYICSFSGVAPNKIKEAKKYLYDSGCPTDFAPDGSAIIHGAQHKDKYNKLMGYTQLTKNDLLNGRR